MAEHKTATFNPLTKADHEHMAALKAGSNTSWGKLYERHQSGLVRFCGNFTADPQLAEDWAQETFIRLKEHKGSFQQGAKLKPWLYKIARNICLNARRSRRDVQWSESAFATRAIELLDPDPSPASKIVGDADTRSILARLSEDQRTAVILRYVEGLTRKEIAEVMDVPEATVKSRLCRAMNALRERLDRV